MVFSFDAFKHSNPQLSSYYKHVVQAKITAEREVTFSFDSPGNRELPLILGQLTVLPKHWWEDDDAPERAAMSSERRWSHRSPPGPTGSRGSSRGVRSFTSGSRIIGAKILMCGAAATISMSCASTISAISRPPSKLSRRAIWIGGWNIAPRHWATGYDFPALADRPRRARRISGPQLGLMQAFAFNVRRPKFKDPQARRALNFAFDFESINKEIFYGQYERVSSYFQGTELASSGLPEGKELQLLQSVREHVPAEVFTTAYWNPVGGSDAARGNLLHGMELLKQAGFRWRTCSSSIPQQASRCRWSSWS